MRRCRADKKTFSEIQDTLVGDLLATRTKYFGFCAGATSKLIKDILRLGRNITAWDKHLDRHADGNYGCSCVENEQECPPLPTWCTPSHLTTFRIKMAKGESDSTRKRRKLT